MEYFCSAIDKPVIPEVGKPVKTEMERALSQLDDAVAEVKRLAIAG